MNNKIIYIFPALFLAIFLSNTAFLSSAEKDSLSTAVCLQESFSDIAERYKPLVVSITGRKIVLEPVRPYRFYYGTPFDSMWEEFLNEPQAGPKSKQQYRERKYEGGGSGVVIGSNGLVLTNYHVVSFADDISVHFAEKNKTYEAKLIGKDPVSDLAILKIVSNDKFEFAQIGNSDNLKVGDWVLAIGSPFGLEQTITAGIVSARRQYLDIEGKNYANMIQTDAAINRGNSGGPLVNIYGQVVGINSAIYAPTGVFSGIGFAIPINKLSDLVKESGDGLFSVLPGKKESKKTVVLVSWQSISVENSSSGLARLYEIPENAKGVVVSKIDYGRSKSDFGLMIGDLIKAINSKEIKNTDDFITVTKNISTLDGISFEIVRGGITFVLTYLERKP